MSFRRSLLRAAFESATALLLAFAFAAPAWSEGPKVYQRVFESPDYHVDQIYRSMQGPIGRVKVSLGGPRSRELYWVTGIHAEVIRADDQSEIGDGLMCHTNLGLADFRLHRRILQPNLTEARYQPRLFTLSQGQTELQLPPGFGLPILSNEPLHLDTQALNLTNPDLDVKVKIRTTIDFVRNAELTTPMKPLFQKAAQGMVLVEGKDGYFGLSESSKEEHGEGCSVGMAAGGDDITDPHGRVFSAHWQVKPGREVNHTLVTQFLDLQFDTTVHFVAIHLHPYAQSLELKDLTAGKRVFIAHATNFEDTIGLEKVESLSFPEGVPIYKDHEYELISVYENTTDQVQDSMAVMFLYMHDKEFVHPKVRRVQGQAGRVETQQGREGSG